MDTSSTSASAFLPTPGPRRAGVAASVTRALDAIADGSLVYVAPICGVPVTLVAAMAEAPDRWRRLTIVTDYLIDPLPLFDHAGAPFEVLSLQPTPAFEAVRRAGALRTISASYGQFLSHLVPGGTAAVDVALVQVSPPGPGGRHSLGVSGGVTAELIRRAPFVIAEVNPHMPYTFGATEVDRHEIDLLVEVEHALVELVVPPGDEAANSIGVNAASEVPEGATLEFGIGAVPEAVLMALRDRTNLGLHGGMISDAVVALAAGGTLTGRRKTLDPGLHVGAGVVGTRRVFDWVDGNPDVHVCGSAYSHGIPVLARQERFCAINSAIEISADGEINAEVAGERVVSGPGGQPDFAIGATLAPGGVSMITLRATAAGGRISRIVDRLPDTSPTTVPRHLTDRVVTEFGVAHLRGRTPAERREALRAVAHPDHRDAL